MTTEKSLREQLQEAYDDVNTPDDPAHEEADELVSELPEEPQDAPVEDHPRDESGKFKEKDKVLDTPEQSESVSEPVLPAPQAWTGAMKEKWSTLPADVQAEITRRENDFHKMVTSSEGELRLGREMKDVISPYMPIIAAEGGSPVSAVQSLLNTAYQLRTGSPQQKAVLIQQIAETYGVDLGVMQSQGNEGDYVRTLQNEIAQLKQTLNPQAIIGQLQEQQENARIQSEVQAFAANPANKHFETVKAAMAPLLASGQAKDLQEAYDMACWANPATRSTLMQAQDADREAKKKAGIAAKKNAAVSIKGSPSPSVGNAVTPNRTLREELEANMAAALGSKI